MTKNNLMRWYTRLSVLLGFVLLVSIFAYIRLYTNADVYGTGTDTAFHGTVEKALMNVTLVVYGADKIIFNTFGLFVLIVLAINLVILILFRNTDEIEDKELKTIHQYNFIVTLLMLVAQALFIFLIPETINGQIKDLFLVVQMPVLSDSISNVVNLNYVLTLFYIGYNIYVLAKTAPEKVVVEEDFDEELFADQYYKDINDPYLNDETNDEDEEDEVDEVDEKEAEKDALV